MNVIWIQTRSIPPPPLLISSFLTLVLNPLQYASQPLDYSERADMPLRSVEVFLLSHFLRLLNSSY